MDCYETSKALPHHRDRRQRKSGASGPIPRTTKELADVSAGPIVRIADH